MPYASESLKAVHDRSGFQCGRPELDRWLIDSALHAATNRTARTFVWADGNRVVAYYALAGHQIRPEAARPLIGRGGPDTIPAVLLAKLALDRRLHGGHLGGALLVDALQRVLVATEQVAARLVVVDAIDTSATAFYEHFGFTRLDAYGTRLVRKVSDVARDFDQR